MPEFGDVAVAAHDNAELTCTVCENGLQALLIHRAHAPVRLHLPVRADEQEPEMAGEFRRAATRPLPPGRIDRGKVARLPRGKCRSHPSTLQRFAPQRPNAQGLDARTWGGESLQH